MEKNESKITDLLVLTVFALFALGILGVLLTGAKGYDALVQRGEQTYTCRTVCQYLTTRVQQADALGTVSLEEFGGCIALVIRQEIGEEGYLTRIYCHDGYLRELFSGEEGSFSPEDGEKLLPVRALSFEQDGSMLSARVTTAEEQQLLFWHLQAGEVLP